MDLTFLNKDTGFVAISDWGNNTGEVYRTLNGGTSWTNILSFTGSIESVCFKNWNEGFVATGISSIGYETTDAGANWSTFSALFYNYGEIRFRDQNTGFWTNRGSAGASYTLDGGATWAVYPVGRFEEGWEAFHQPGSSAAFLMTWNGQVHKSNSDTNWVFMGQIPGGKDIFFRDDNNGYLVTTGQVYATGDGGANWNSISSNGGYGVAFQSPNNLYVVNGNSNISLSTDGGTTFSPMTGTNNDVEELIVVENVIYAFGSHVYKLGAATSTQAAAEQTRIDIFPNPTSDRLHIAQEGPFQQLDYEIGNLQGQIVLKGKIRSERSIDLSGLGMGVYLITLRKGGGFVSSKRFVKQ